MQTPAAPARARRGVGGADGDVGAGAQYQGSLPLMKSASSPPSMRRYRFTIWVDCGDGYRYTASLWEGTYRVPIVCAGGNRALWGAVALCEPTAIPQHRSPCALSVRSRLRQARGVPCASRL